MQNGEQFWNVAQVAARFGVAQKTVRRWLKAGKLTGVKPGATPGADGLTHWRISESAIAEFVAASHTNKTEAEGAN